MAQTDPTLPSNSVGVDFDFTRTRTPENMPYNGSDLGHNYLPSSLNDPSGLEAFMNENQGKLHTFANWVAQAGGSAVLGTLETAGYLGDFEQHGALMQGEEQEYDNWLSNAMRDAKEGLKEAMPIYRSREGQEVFSPGSRSFWTSNSPDVIGSVIGLMLPGMIAGKAAGGLAGLVRAGKVGKEVSQLAGATIASRYAESTMEANQVFQDMISKGATTEQAADAASKTWKSNWLLAIQDMYQFSTLMKGVKAASRGLKGLRLSDLVLNPVSEAAEEGLQYIFQEEAKQSGFKGGKDYFSNGFLKERLSDYIQSEEFQASAMLGALGGAIFQAPGFASNLVNRQKGLNLQALAKERANYMGNVGLSKKIDNRIFADLAFKHLDAGSPDELKQTLEEFTKNPDLEPDVRAGIKQHIDDVDYLVKQQAQMESMFPKDKQLQRKALADYYDLRQEGRFIKDLEKEWDKVYNDLTQNNELPQQLVELHKQKINAEALAALGGQDPIFTIASIEANAAYQQALAQMPEAEKIKNALLTARDSELLNLMKQSLQSRSKIEDLRGEIAKYATPEGREQVKKEEAEKEALRKAEAVINDDKSTKEQLKAVLDSTENEETKKKIQERLDAMDAAESAAKQAQTAEAINQPGEAVGEEIGTEQPTGELKGDEDFTGELQGDEEFDFFDEDYTLDPEDNILPPGEIPEEPKEDILDGGITYTEAKNLYGKDTADRLLEKLKSEQAPDKPKQKAPPLDEAQAKETLRSSGTVPAWAKMYQGNWVGEKFKLTLDSTGRPIPQQYWDSVDNKWVEASEVFETDQHGHDIASTPLVKTGDKVILKVENDFRYTLKQGFVPATPDHYVINIYRANDKGEQIGKKPMAQLPNADNDKSASNYLDDLRSSVIFSPSQTYITTIAKKNIGDPKKAAGRNSLDVLEFDYHLTDNDNWSYSQTPYKPVFAIADFNGNIFPVEHLGAMKGLNPATKDKVQNTLDQLYDENGEIKQKRTPNVKGGIYTLRMNPQGNYSLVMVYPRNLNTSELQWLKDKMGKLLAEKSPDLEQVYYIPTHGAGVLSSDEGKRIPDVVGLDRRRFHIVNLTKGHSNLLIPVNEKGGGRAWITIQASGQSPQVENFIKGDPFFFSVIDGKGNTTKKVWNSAEATPERLKIIRDAFERTLNHAQTSKRNISKDNINREETFTDPATGKNYPTYYDFMKDGIVETDLPGGKTKGYGAESSYSFANARVRLAAAPYNTVVVDEESGTITQNVPPVQQEPTKPSVEETEESIEEILKKRFGPSGEKTRLKPSEGFEVITERELDWFKKMFGEEFLSIAKGVDKVISSQGVEAFGLYHNALVTLANLGEKGTTYHEAFHFVFDPQLGVISNKERERILDEASKIYGIERSYDDTTREKLRPTYTNISNQEFWERRYNPNTKYTGPRKGVPIEQRIKNIEQSLRNSYVSKINTNANVSIAKLGKVGEIVPITLKFLENIKKNPTHSTSLDKPFQFKDANPREAEVLKEFYQFVIDELREFSAHSGKPEPKSIPNERLVTKLSQWLEENYGLQTITTEKGPYPYGLSSIIQPTYQVRGGEVFIADDYHFPHIASGHNKDLTEDVHSNTIGWFIETLIGDYREGTALSEDEATRFIKLGWVEDGKDELGFKKFKNPSKVTNDLFLYEFQSDIIPEVKEGKYKFSQVVEDGKKKYVLYVYGILAGYVNGTTREEIRSSIRLLLEGFLDEQGEDFARQKVAAEKAMREKSGPDIRYEREILLAKYLDSKRRFKLIHRLRRQHGNDPNFLYTLKEKLGVAFDSFMDILPHEKIGSNIQHFTRNPAEDSPAREEYPTDLFQPEPWADDEADFQNSRPTTKIQSYEYEGFIFDRLTVEMLLNKLEYIAKESHKGRRRAVQTFKTELGKKYTLADYKKDLKKLESRYIKHKMSVSGKYQFLKANPKAIDDYYSNRQKAIQNFYEENVVSKVEDSVNAAVEAITDNFIKQGQAVYDDVDVADLNKELSKLQKDYEYWYKIMFEKFIRIALKKAKDQGYNEVYLPTYEAMTEIEGSKSTGRIYTAPQEERDKAAWEKTQWQSDWKFNDDKYKKYPSNEIGAAEALKDNVSPNDIEWGYFKNNIPITKEEYDKAAEAYSRSRKVGPFYAALSKIKGVNIVGLEQPDWSTAKLLKVKLDDFAPRNIERFRTVGGVEAQELTGDEQLEEKLAEDFRAYMLSDGRVVPKVASSKNFFKKLLEAIKRLLGLKSPIEKLFKDIATKPISPEVRRRGYALMAQGMLDAENERTRKLPGFSFYTQQEEAIQATVHAVMNMAAAEADAKGVNILDVLKERPTNEAGKVVSNVERYLELIRNQFAEDARRVEKVRTPEAIERYVTYLAMGVAYNDSPRYKEYMGTWEDREAKPGDLSITTGFKTEVYKAFKQFGLTVNIVDKTVYDIEENEDATEDLTEGEIMELSQEDEGERVHDIDHTLRNPNNTLSQRLRFFLSSIESPGSTPTVLGTPRYIRFNRVMSSLKAKLAGAPNPIKKLEQLAETDAVSKAVFDALSKEIHKGNDRLVNSFNTGLNLALHNFKSIINEYDPKEGYVVPRFIDTDRASLHKALKNKWKENSIRKELLQPDGTTVMKERANGIYKELMTFKTKYDVAKISGVPLKYADVKKKFIDLLEDVGIQLPQQVWTELEAIPNPGRHRDRLEKWFFGEKKASLQQFLINAKDGKDPYDGTSGISDILAGRSKNYVEDLKGDTFMNEFNKQVNPINLPSYLTDLIDTFKNTEEAIAIRNFFQADNFYKENMFLALFGTNASERVSLDFISALRTEGNDPKDFTDRTAGDSILARIIAFDKGDQYSSIFLGTFSDKSKQATLALPRKKGQAAYDFIFGVLKRTAHAEAYRINRIKDNPTFKDKFPANYVSRGSRFLYIPELNSIPGASDSLTSGKLSPEEAFAIEQKINEAIKEHIKKEYDLFKEYLTKNGVLTKDKVYGRLPEALFKGRSVDDVLKEFFYNDLGWRTEVSKVLMGDYALYKDADDYYKRGYQPVTPGIVPTSYTEGDESYTRGIFPKQIFKATPEEMKSLEKVLGKELAKLYGPENKDGGVNKTDAQSYVNTETYRRMAKTWDYWSNDMEALYDFAWKDNRTVSQAIRARGVDKSTADYYNDLLRKVRIQPLKPFQYNDRPITLPDGSTLIIKEEFKDSWMWLNPELTNRHTEFAKLATFMKDHKFDVMSAADSIKVGSYGVIEDLQGYDPKKDGWKKRTIKFSQTRFPQMMPDAAKEEVPLTQFWKLLVGNLDPKDGRVVEFNKLWEQKIRGSSEKIREKLDLSEDLQLSTEPERRAKQLFKLNILLQNQLASRTVGDNYNDAIKVEKDENGQPNFTVHLGFPIYAKKFMSILTNMFKKGVLQQKSAGFSMVNFADYGIEHGVESSNLHLVEEDGHIIAEIGMPVSFFRKIGIDLKRDFDYPSRKIKWSEISDEQRKALEFVLCRIPTSNKSSMIPCRIAMIVPESSGNVVMLPGELTIQQGLDFDVDKSYIIRRVVGDRGKIDRGDLDTKLFDVAWSILTDKAVVKEMMTPLNFDTIEAIGTNYENRGIISSQSSSSLLAAPTDVDFEIRNKHGKRMIGIDSRANTAHAVLQTIKQHVQIKPGAGFYLAGEVYETLGGLYDQTGNTLISKNYGELQQSSLDNAKKPIKALLNIFPITDPIVLYLTGLGVPLATSIAYINQPVLREWVKYYDMQGGSVDKATKALLDANPQLASMVRDIQDGGAAILPSASGLKSALGGQIITEVQAAVLIDFLRLHKVSQVMTKVNNVLSVDTFRDMTGVEPLELFLNQRDDITNQDSPIYIDPVIFDLKKAPEVGRRLAAFYKYGVEDAVAFINQFAPYQSQPYLSAKSNFAHLQGLERLTSKDTVRALNTFLDYFVLESTGKLTPILEKMAPNSRDRWSMFDPERSMWKYMERLLGAYPALKENNLIKNIIIYPSREGNAQIIGIVNTSSNINRNDITQGWYDLLHDGKEDVRLFANDLIRYSIITSGLGFTTRSFVDLVPIDFWSQSGLVKEHKILLEGLRAGLTKIDGEASTRSFIRHKFMDLDEVPETYYEVNNEGKVRTKLLGIQTEEGFPTHVMSFSISPIDPLATNARRFAPPTFVKIWDDKANKYRLYESSPTDRFSYREVEPLGEPRNYWEVAFNSDGRKHTAHPGNLNSGVPAPWDDFKPQSFKAIGSAKDGVNKYINKYIPGKEAGAQEVITRLLKAETNVANKQTLEVLLRNVDKIVAPLQIMPEYIKKHHPDEVARYSVIPAGVFPTDGPESGMISWIWFDDRKDIDDETTRKVLIHELNHAYSIAILQHPETEEEKSFVRNITRLRQEANATGKFKDWEYIMESNEEFLAELASSSRFRSDLRGLTGFWDRLLRLFRKLLGMKDSYDKVLDQYYKVLDHGSDLQAPTADSSLNYRKEVRADQKRKIEGQKRIDALQRMLSSLEERVSRLRKQGKKDQAKKLHEKYKILQELVAANRSHAIVRYLLTVQEEMKELETLYYAMEKDPATLNPDTLHSMLEQITSYKLLDSFMNEIRRSPIDFAPDAEAGENLLKNIRELIGRVTDLEVKLKDLRIERYAYLVEKESKDPNKSIESIKDNLEVADRDITIYNHWTGGGSDQRDDIVRTNHVMLRRAHSNAYRNTQQDLYKKDTTDTEVNFQYLVEDKKKRKRWRVANYTYKKTGLYAALDAYEGWLRANGKSADSITDKFAPILDQSSFGEKSDGVKFISPLSDQGKAILARKKDDPLRVFYVNIVLGYLHSQEKLPRFLRPGLRIPSIRRTLLEAVLREQGVRAAVTESLISAVQRRYDETDLKAVDEAGNPIKGLPVRFVAKHDGISGRLTPREVSLDIATTVGLFMHESNTRNELEPILSDLEMGKGIAGDRKVLKADKRKPGFAGLLSPTRTAATLANGLLDQMDGTESEAYKKVKQDLEMLAYGEYKKDEGDVELFGLKFNIGKTTDAFLRATGFNLLFGRIAIPITNAMVGKITQLKEAIGGNIIDETDMAAGEKFYFLDATQSFFDLGRREKKTRFGKFFAVLNPLDQNRPVFDIGISTNYMRTVFEKVIRSGSSGTEFYLGATALGSVLNKDQFQAIDSEGNKASLYEATEVTDQGRLELKKGYKYKGKSEINGEDLNEFRDYVLRLYQIMNGIYNKIDSGNAQQYALGRALTFMRRWLPEGINTRWRTRFFDHRVTQENEGHYISALVAMNNIFSREGKLQNMIDAVRIGTWMGVTDEKLLLHPEELDLSEEQQAAIIDMRKANIRKTLFELYVIAGLSLLLAFGWDEDDDDSYVRYMIARINRELKAFGSPSTAWDVLRKPSVAMATSEGIFRIVGDTIPATSALIQGEPLPEYEQGDYKGQPKIGADIKRQVGLGWLEQFDNLDTKSNLMERGFR